MSAPLELRLYNTRTRRKELFEPLVTPKFLEDLLA